MRLKELKRIVKKFETYDRVYYHGKLSSALIVLLSLFLILCIIVLCILFKMEG